VSRSAPNRVIGAVRVGLQGQWLLPAERRVGNLGE
jgi:hypothetical protein